MYFASPDDEGGKLHPRDDGTSPAHTEEDNASNFINFDRNNDPDEPSSSVEDDDSLSDTDDDDDDAPWCHG